MNHTALLKRAFEIVRRYPVLWLFGILVALTSGGGGSGSGYNFNQADFQRGNWPDWLPFDRWSRFDPGAYLGIIVFCCCLLLILGIVALIVQYVARTALIRGVDQIEDTGSAPTWRQGFRLGWSNRAFRLWLLELIVGVLVALAALILLALCASPLLLLLVQSDAARVIGIVLTVILGLLWLLVVIIAAIALSLLGKFWEREIVLADRGIGEALSGGYALVRWRLKDVGVMWLLMLAINIGFAILMLPVALVMALLAGALGGGLGYAIHAVTGGSVVWAIAAGLPVFLLVLGIPLTIVGGIFQSYRSSVWTLTYREVVGAAQPALAAA